MVTSAIFGGGAGPVRGRGWRVAAHVALAVAPALGWAPHGAWAQPVWKCEQAGEVRYSDKPCPGGGQPVSGRSLQPNVVDGLRPAPGAASAARVSLAEAARPAEPPGNVCPGDAEIRGMETRAGSTTLGDDERRFLQDELRRALQCRAGQGRYTEADWAVSRAAQAAQSQLGERARRDARTRAEAMHSAADPLEGDRIAQRRLAEERQQRRDPRPWPPGQNPGSPHSR